VRSSSRASDKGLITDQIVMETTSVNTPETDAMDAHCRRVGVLADEVMARLSWSDADRSLVRKAVGGTSQLAGANRSPAPWRGITRPHTAGEAAHGAARK